MGEQSESQPGNWRWGLLLVAALFTGVSIYQLTLTEEYGSGAVVGAALFGACGLLAFLRARRRV